MSAAEERGLVGVKGWGRGNSRVDVDGEVDRVFGSDPGLDLVDNAPSRDVSKSSRAAGAVQRGVSNIRSQGINFPRLYPREPTVPIVLVVTWPTQRSPNASMDVAVIGQQALLRSPIEVRAMVDSCLFTRCTTEYARLPGVQMRVKMNNADGSVGLIDTAQKWEGDGVVTTQSDDTREGFA